VTDEVDDDAGRIAEEEAPDVPRLVGQRVHDLDARVRRRADARDPAHVELLLEPGDSS